MPRVTHTPGTFRQLVGTFDGATDPSRNGNLGKPQRLMSGIESQQLYFSGNGGTGMSLGGTGQVGNLSGSTTRATAAFVVLNATITSTAYLEIFDIGVGTFDLGFSGVPALAIPVTLTAIAVGVDANDTVANAKAAIDGDATLAALFATTVQADTPAVGQARLAIVAKKLGPKANSVTLTVTDPGGGTPDYRILDASFAVQTDDNTNKFSGGDTDPNLMTFGVVSFNAEDVLTGEPNYPALVNDSATRNGMAAALAVAISRIPQFNADSVGAVISILGPAGPDGGTYQFLIKQTGLVNYGNLVPDSGFLAVGAPQISAPILS
jgi:hypothetical protein